MDEKLKRYLRSLAAKQPSRYRGLEGEELARTFYEWHYRPDAPDQALDPVTGEPVVLTYSQFLEDITANAEKFAETEAAVEPEQERNRLVDYALSAGIGGLLGAFGGPVGAGVGVASGLAGTAVDHGLDKAGVPGYIRFPASVVAGGGVSKVGTQGLNAALKNLRPGAAQYLDDVAAMNVRPRAGDINPAVRITEDALEAAGSPAVMQSSRGQIEDVGRATQRFADDMAPDLPIGPGGRVVSLASATPQTNDRIIVNMLKEGYDTAVARSKALFDDVARQAEGVVVPLRSTGAKVEKLLKDLEDFPGGAMHDLAKHLKRVIDRGEELTYERVRFIQSTLNEYVKNPATVIGGNNEAKNAKFLLSGILDDLDQWSRGAGDIGQAHIDALEFFKDNVTPFRKVPAIWNAVTGEVIEGFQPQGVDGFIRRVVGYSGSGRPEATNFLVNLLPDDGARVVAFDILENVAERATKGATVDFATGAAKQALNLGTRARPRSGRIAIGGTDPQRAERLNRIFSTVRGNTSRLPTQTGKYNLPAMITGGSGTAGMMTGGLLGSPELAVAGAVGVPALTRGLINTAGRVVTSNPYIRYSMGQPGSYLPGAFGGGTSGLLDFSDMLQERNRNLGRR